MNQDITQKSKIISSLFWKLMERGGTQGIQFIVQIVLARLLLPEDYGRIALVAIFISLANVFVQNGFNTALIQKKDADEVDFSSVFYISLFVSGLIYLVLFFTSPLIAEFFMDPQLILVLRVLSITLFFGAFNSIQNAYIARNMMFKKLFFSSLGASLTSGIVGIILAFSGGGVWALVAQQLTNQLSTSIILGISVKWRPSTLFSLERVKVLFSFGWKLLVAGLIDTFYMNIRSIIIGRIYNPITLGFFNRGIQFPELIVLNINGSIQSIMLPVLSSSQENMKSVKDIVKKSIVASSYIVFPMMVGLAVVAEPLIKILLTDKWLPAVPFLQIYCASYALMPIHTANLQAINALGRSDIFLRLEIIKKIYGLIILGISIPFGIYAIAWGSLISGLISTFINSYPNIKLLDYSYREQWYDIMPSLLISLVMGVIAYSISFFVHGTWLVLVLQILTGFITYIGISKLFKIEILNNLMLILKNSIERKTGVRE